MVQRGMGKLDSTIRLRDFRISNMLATCRLPFGIKIEEMAKKYPTAVYEPELTVGQFVFWFGERLKQGFKLFE